MPVIKFEEKYRAEGLHALILQGEVYCLPDNVFIVPRSSLDYLDGAKIPYLILRAMPHPLGWGIARQTPSVSEKMLIL